MIDEKDNNNLDSQLQENADKESTIEENQLQGENSPSDAQISDNQEEIQSKVDKKSEHEVIHKKDGRLHIYIRQDKYKGELKSKNWVGRLYIEGKQKISSSGTPNLEEAIPILEKWFDELQLEKNENIPVKEQFIEQNQENNPKNDAVIPTTKENNDVVSAAPISEVSKVAMQEPTKGVAISMLEKLKNFKFSKSKNNNATSEEVAGEDKNQKTKENKLKKVFQNFFQSKVSKLSVAGEEIAGLDMTREAIRVAQVSQDKDEKWILDKYSYRLLDQEKISENLLEHKDYLAEEIELALSNAKITSKNVALSIPVTSAIIRVVTSPLMTDVELQKAVETDSLWENLVQLTDNLADYSIFHQVINRNEKDNTMEILFVASKLSDINNYTKIIKKGGLNPVIIDVKCFALKSAVDQINQLSGSIESSNLTALLEFGLDENYVMILNENNPIITDIFIRGQDRKIIKDPSNQEEADAFSRRYITQVKQAISDFEVKYEKRIRNIKVISNEQNVEDFLGRFRKTLANTGFNLLDPLDGIKIPVQLQETTKLVNKSYLSTVMGLAFRKLDVFGYYKFVTAVKNINLLPNRDNMIKQKKMKIFSNFAFKGVVGIVALIYVTLFGLSFWNIQKYNKALVDYESVKSTHGLVVIQKDGLIKKLGLMTKTLDLSKSIKSNKKINYRILAQVASSVPNRVRFQSLEYNGSDLLVIMGDAFSDQDILKLIANLNTKSLVSQASLASMNLPNTTDGSSQAMKGFKIAVILKGEI